MTTNQALPGGRLSLRADAQWWAFHDCGVSADGQWFLAKVPTEDVTGRPIHIVANWLSLLAE